MVWLHCFDHDIIDSWPRVSIYIMIPVSSNSKYQPFVRAQMPCRSREGNVHLQRHAMWDLALFR